MILPPDMGHLRPVWWQKNGQGRGWGLKGKREVRGYLASSSWVSSLGGTVVLTHPGQGDGS